MEFDLIIRAQHVITDIGDRPAAVCVKNRKIVKIVGFADVLSADTDITLSGALIPGLVDSHVHINEPGRTQWEGFESATKAAAAGGITTVIDMPLNSIPPTVNVAALAVKKAAAEKPAAPKPAAKKVAVKKAAAEKPVAKKAAAKKTSKEEK